MSVAVIFAVIVTGCRGSGDSNNAKNLERQTDPVIVGQQQDTAADVLRWPIIEGVYGEPSLTYTLKANAGTNFIYINDIQAQIDIDWQELDRLYISGGHYSFIKIRNLPQRSAAKPLIITNIDGQVKVGGMGHYYLLELIGGSNWILTGRYDAQSQTGDENFPGHRGGNFANSQNSYGIMIDDDFITDQISGLQVEGATEFEIEYLEITAVTFAGMKIKNKGENIQPMEKVKLHDNYIHDVGTEGLYIGSTGSAPLNQIRDWKIFNNRVLRTGAEAIQLSQLGGHNQVYNNVFGPAAIDWRAIFQNYQDSNLQIGIRGGYLEIDKNIFIGAAGTLISLFSRPVEGDDTEQNVGVTMTNNYFVGTRNLGMYMNNVAIPGMTYRFENNAFSGYRFEYNEVHSHVSPTGALLKIANLETPIIFQDNTWNGPLNFTTGLANNGTHNNQLGVDNVNAQPSLVIFENSDLPNNQDVLNLEMWADIATLGDKQPVEYFMDDIVMHYTKVYQCVMGVCTGGIEPQNNLSMWEELAQPVDDVRIVANSAWEHLGLQPEQ
ncbi:MAG: hypothetical protein MJK10_11525 [Pseudomonadales bacterium]|nr:hypothetical protein [Pseudomonadales bacterium]